MNNQQQLLNMETLHGREHLSFPLLKQQMAHLG